MRVWLTSSLFIAWLLVSTQPEMFGLGQPERSLSANSTSVPRDDACGFPAVSSQGTNTSMLFRVANNSDGPSLADILYSHVDGNLDGAPRPTFLFCLIPKNACTSFRRLLMRITLSQQAWGTYSSREQLAYGNLYKMMDTCGNASVCKCA